MVDKKFVVLLVLALSPSLCYSESSKSTYYGSPYCHAPPPTGACGYGAYGKDINGGYVASVARLYNHGLGCGACYEIKCTAAECNEDGVKVVVTDFGASEGDFILTVPAFAKMARGGMENKLLGYGHAEVEYNRIPCQFHGRNIAFKIHEPSQYPHYLAFVILYQGGMSDITAVEAYEEASDQWRPYRRVYGAVWDMQNPPRGSLTVRFLVCSGAQRRWVVLNNVISTNWKAGDVYDTSVQIS